MNETEATWKETTIGEIIYNLYDGPHATPEPSDEGPIFLGIKNITEDGRLDLTDVRHISEDAFPKWTRRVTPREGDIVFTYEATLNRYAIIPAGFRGCLGRRLALLRTDPAKVDTQFLFYYFFGSAWRNVIAQNILSGSTVDRIPLTNFPKFPLKLPPLETQQQIAAILSVYDDLIENNARRIKVLEEMAGLIYREWFVNFRFPGHEGVKMLDSEFGEIPEGWTVEKLGDVLELAYGKALKADSRIFGAFPVYGSGGVVGQHNVAMVNAPGIIVGRKGNVGSVFWSDVDFWPIDTVFYVVSDIPLHFLYFNLQQQAFLNSDAAVPGLSRNQAYLNPITVPSPEILQRFQQIIVPIFEHLRVSRLKNQNLRQTRDLLLPKLISGELDVSGLGEAQPETAQVA